LSIYDFSADTKARRHEVFLPRIDTNFLDADFEVCGLIWGGDRKYISICVYTNILL